MDIHDAIELEKRGIPTATICSTEFVALGRTEAAALGLTRLPIAVIQHPLGGLQAEHVQTRAHSVVDTVHRLLTTPRQQLMTMP